MRKTLVIILAIISSVSLVLFSSIGCSSKPKVGLSETSLELLVDETHQLVVNNYEGEYLWSSLDERICSVSEEGVVTAKYIGNTSIVCYYEGGFLRCNVNVIENKTPAEQASINTTNLVLYRNDEYKLKITKNLGENIVEGGTTVWTSSNPEIVSVSSEGVVKALDINANGEPVIITAVHTDGDNEYTFTCDVSVILKVAIEQKDSLTLYTGFGEYEINPIANFLEQSDKHEYNESNFKYSSVDESIVEISPEGVITPKKGGRTQVLINYNDYGYKYIDVLVYNKLIYSKNDFLGIQPNDYALLMNDIDFTKTSVTGGIAINGLFNGNGYALNNITLVPNDWESITGKQVFGKVSGEIINLEVHNLTVKKFWEQMCGASALMSTVSGRVENIVFDGLIEGRVAIDYNGTNYTTWSGSKSGYLMKTSNNATAKNIYIDVNRDDSSSDFKVVHGSGTLNMTNVYVVPDDFATTTYGTYNIVDGFFMVGSEQRFLSNNLVDSMGSDVWQIENDKPVLKNGLVQFDLPDDVWTLTFDANGGSEVQDSYVKDGGLIKSFPDSYKEGYILKGWCKAGSTTVSSAGLTVKGNMSFVAKWAKAYYVVFDSDGGTEVEPILTEVGRTLTADGVTKVPAPTKENKALKGWVLLGEEELFNFSTRVIEEGMVFVAQWVDTVTCTFDADGGALVDDMQVGEGLKIKTMPTTSMPGHTFIGWYLVKDGVVSENVFDNANTEINEATTFKAKWVVNVKLTFDAQGGSEVNDIEVGKGLKLATSKIPVSVKPGYILAGWIKSGGFTVFDFANTTISKDTKFKAKWLKADALVNFSDGTGLTKVTGKGGFNAFSINSDIVYGASTASLKVDILAKESKVIYLNSSNWSNYTTITFRISHDAWEYSAWFSTANESASIWNVKDQVGHFGYQLYGRRGSWVEVKLTINANGTYNLYYNNVLRAQNEVLGGTFPITLLNNQVIDHSFYVSDVFGVPRTSSGGGGY